MRSVGEKKIEGEPEQNDETEDTADAPRPDLDRVGRDLFGRPFLAHGFSALAAAIADQRGEGKAGSNVRCIVGFREGRSAGQRGEITIE